jgi:predicted nucleotidyltransferase
MKEMTMLDLALVDLRVLAEALEDNSEQQTWWFDSTTGRLDVWLEEGLNESDEISFEERGWISVEPIDRHDAYGDLTDFTALVTPPRARDLLERAISGRGAFRRFKDTLFDFPELRDEWFRFHDARMRTRAIMWLVERGLVSERDAAGPLSELAEEEPVRTSAFDAGTIARNVAADLRTVYGDRLRRVVLFGSWARGDAHPESDIDLMVVLSDLSEPSGWSERRAIDAVLWRHSFDNDTVVSATVVSEHDFNERRLPVLVNARREGVDVG